MTTTVRYYFDEHVRRAVADALQSLGIDVLTTQDAHRADAGAGDEEQLEYASQAGRVLVTNDADFLNPARIPQLMTGQHAGITFISQQVSIGEHIRLLRFIAETETMESLVGSIRFYHVVPRGMLSDD